MSIYAAQMLREEMIKSLLLPLRAGIIGVYHRGWGVMHARKVLCQLTKSPAFNSIDSNC